MRTSTRIPSPRAADRTSNSAHQLTAVGSTSLAYDAHAASSTWQVTERLTYNPYGSFTVSVCDNTGTWHNNWGDYLDWNITFQGGRWNPLTRQVHFGTQNGRDLDVDTGRWTTPDIAPFDGLDLYPFCAANPINRTDPSGLQYDPNSAKALTQHNTTTGFVGFSISSVGFSLSGGPFNLNIDSNGLGDLYALAERIRTDLLTGTKYDRSGKCGRAIDSLTFIGEGSEAFPRIRGVTAVVSPGEAAQQLAIKNGTPIPAPWQPPADRPPSPMNNETFLGSEDGTEALTPATIAFFTAMKTLESEDGIDVTFYSCQAGNGANGRAMLQNVANILGAKSKVKGYVGNVKQIGNILLVGSVTATVVTPSTAPATAP